jgi:hypothetical protein
MKAKCPYCDSGCSQCKGGFIEVGFLKGRVFTRHCEDCGFDNGGRVVEHGDSPPEKKPEPCVRCGSEKMSWEDTGVETR